MKKNELIGTWKLVSFKISWDDGRKIIYPYGEDPKGYLIYTSSHVSVHIMRSARPKFHSDEYKNTSDSEKIEMADNYGGYVGRYEICDNTIIHYPEVSMFPNFTQTPQHREFQFLGHRLILQCPYPSTEHGNQGISSVVWEREELVKDI